MAVFMVTDPTSGLRLRLTGDTAPTEAELEQIFSQQAATPQPAVQQPQQAQPADLQAQTGQPQSLRDIALSERGVLGTTKDRTTDIFDPLTGSRRIRETPELGTLPEFAATEEGDTFKIAAGLLSTFNPKAQRDIIAEQIPGSTFETTPDGSTIIEVPVEGGGTRRSVLNAPGFSQQDITTALAQVLTFVGPGRLARLGKTVTQKAAIGGAAAGGTEQALQELGVSLGREERDPLGTGIAAVTGGLGEAIVPAFQAIKSKRQDALKAIEDARTGKITEKGTEDIADVIQKGTPEEVAEVIKADPEFFRAADELGISTEPLAGFTSLNPQFRDVEAALRKVPGSALDPQAIKFIEETSKAADDLIQRYGGTLDKAQLGLDFKRQSIEAVDNLFQQADDAYGQLRQLIPETNRFAAPSTVEFLEGLAKAEKIPPRLRRILNEIKPKTKTTKGKRIVSAATGKLILTGTTETTQPTLGKIDQLRREIGQAINKGSGPFKDVETGLNKALYARLTRDQDAIASGVEGGVAVSDTAKGLVRQRKQIEDNLQVLLGKDLNQALNINVAGAIKNLTKGEIDRFNAVMNAIPKEKRGEVALSAMNDVFKGTGVGQQGLSPTQFVKWFETLNRSPAAKKALFETLPRDSIKAVNNLFRVSKGISRSLAQTTPTGRINALFNPDTGIIRKMVGRLVAPAVAVATGSPTASAATNVTMSFLKQTTDGAKRASTLMASPEFQNIVRESVKEGVIDGAIASKKLIAAETKLARSKVYQKWAETLSAGDRKALQNGLVRYLFQEDLDQEANQ
ncbi:MAG: hypothetical protein V3T88_06020 [Nitrosomonadaceae bacterium]